MLIVNNADPDEMLQGVAFNLLVNVTLSGIFLGWVQTILRKKLRVIE